MPKPPCDNGVVLASADAATPALGRWVLAATILGSSMVFIDDTVVNVALPVLQRELRATLIDAQWIVGAYALCLGTLMLVGGALGDRYGRRHMFCLGVLLFAGASAWCGAAGSIEQLIVARILQGVGGALLTPGSLAIIGASFGADERGRAIGTWSGFSAMLAGCGPVVGGLLIDRLSWRWAFWINIPIALVTLAIAWRHVPESRDENARGKLDWPGALLATLGLGGIVFGLIESSNPLTDGRYLLVPIGLGLMALVGFVIVEARSSAPMMPLTVFRSRTFSGANLLTLLLYAALTGALFFFPFNLIQIQGYSATAAGAALLPAILLMFFLSRWSGGLITRYGAKRPLILGPLIAAAGFLLMARPAVGGSYWTTFFPAVFVMGLGMALSVAPLTTAVMEALGPSRAGLASGINNAVAQVGSLLAIAILGALLILAFNHQLDRRLAALDLPPAAKTEVQRQRTALGAIQIPDNLTEPQRAAVRHAIAASFVFGFRILMLIAAGLAGAAALIAWRMIES